MNDLTWLIEHVDEFNPSYEEMDLIFVRKRSDGTRYVADYADSRGWPDKIYIDGTQMYTEDEFIHAKYIKENSDERNSH